VDLKGIGRKTVQRIHVKSPLQLLEKNRIRH
jgi:hypothetical protein